MPTTPRLGYPLIDTSQGSKEVTHALGLYVSDALVQTVVQDKDASAPPGSPADGAVYIVGAAPSGAWTGKANHLAQWITAIGAWTFYAPFEGLEAYVADEDARYQYNGAAWEKQLGRLLSGTAASINPASLAAGASQFVANVTVTGAAVGDSIESIGHGDTSTANWQLQHWSGVVDQADRVACSQQNRHSAAVDLASATLTARVRKA